jgi:hypothetical protein
MRGGLCWEWPYMRGGLCWKCPYMKVAFVGNGLT